jgi:hypothetical protein
MASMHQFLQFAFATLPSLPRYRSFRHVEADCLYEIAGAYREYLNKQALCDIRTFQTWSYIVDMADRLAQR